VRAIGRELGAGPQHRSPPCPRSERGRTGWQVVRPRRHPRPPSPIPPAVGRGCTVAAAFEEVRERGYSCGESVVKKYVHRLRGAVPVARPLKTPSVRDVAGWLTRLPDRLTGDQAQRLKEIRPAAPSSTAPPTTSARSPSS
jgi:hypothetical protein